MSNLLGLQYRKAIKKIEELSHVLFDSQNIPYYLDEKTSIYTSGVRSNESTGLMNDVVIGIKGLKDSSSFLAQSVSDQNFARVIVNIFHEATHCEQKTVMFQKDNPTQNDINQALSDLACRRNKNYYMYSGNYYNNPNEVHAEYQGIMGAYDYLCKAFPYIDKKQHERIVLNVVNCKAKTGSYFIGVANGRQVVFYNSLKRVQCDFEKAYNNSFTCERKYNTTNHSNPDDVGRYTATHKDAREVCLEQKTGVDKDRVIAAINCYLHPEYQSQYKSLVDIDLSYETSITKPYQEYLRNKENERKILQEQERYTKRTRENESKFGHLLKADVEQQSDRQYDG